MSRTHSAVSIQSAIDSLAVRNTPNIRAIRKRASRELQDASAAEVLRVARGVISSGARWVGYELITNHFATLESLDLRAVEELGKGIASWDQVDTFALYISGPVWRNCQVRDRDVLAWAKSTDRWWRRAALVSTVSLNAKSQGGSGDTPRTLKICRALVGDSDDMVEKAMSWALRILISPDRDAVVAYIREQESVLGARVLREVRNKLDTGLKNPKRRGR